MSGRLLHAKQVLGRDKESWSRQSFYGSVSRQRFLVSQHGS